MPILEVRDVRKSFGKVEALRGVTLSVDEGDLFGLLGPNGAGKTTLLAILACLSDPTSGTVSLFGKPLSREDLTLRPLIGLATQELALYGELTARENLAFFGKLYGLRGSDLSKRVEEILDFTALQPKADARAATYSGGMKRRLNLGIAVMHRPRLLFLDEPTTGVDPQSRNHLFEQVKALNADGVTVVYTSHYMEEVEALCPRIAILDHGKTIASDTRANLLRSLEGTLIIRVADPSRVGPIEGVPEVERSGDTITLAASEVEAATVRVIETLRKLDVELLGLQAKPPTLEQVFLHLTDKAVRD